MNVNYSASIIMILSNTVCPKFQVAIILLLFKKSVLRARINESWMLTDFFAIIFFFKYSNARSPFSSFTFGEMQHFKH